MCNISIILFQAFAVWIKQSFGNQGEEQAGRGVC
jgi:hypothetical protein